MTKKQQNVLILILGFIAALGPFSIDMYLPGFPAIARDLNTDISHVSLTLTTYFAGIAAGQLIYGPLLERYGRKRPLIIGLGIYAFAAIGCALAPDVFFLIGLRLVQALGGCVGMVASRAIVRDHFSARETAGVFSTLLLVMGVAPIIAPTVGGYITSHFGWRFIFVILSLISLVLIFVIFKFLGESKRPDSSVSLRVKSVGRNYFNVLSNPQFLLYGLASSIAMAGMFAYISGAPFALMEIYGYSDKVFGWIFGINALGFIAGSQVNRLLLRRYDLIAITNGAAVFFILAGGILISSAWWFPLPAIWFLAILFTYLFFLGFINPNATALSLERFEKNAGIASALIGSFRMFSGAITSALIGILHNGTVVPLTILMAICSLLTFALLLVARQLKTSEESVFSNQRSR